MCLSRPPACLHVRGLDLSHGSEAPKTKIPKTFATEFEPHFLKKPWHESVTGFVICGFQVRHVAGASPRAPRAAPLGLTSPWPAATRPARMVVWKRVGSYVLASWKFQQKISHAAISWFCWSFWLGNGRVEKREEGRARGGREFTGWCFCVRSRVREKDGIRVLIIRSLVVQIKA